MILSLDAPTVTLETAGGKALNLSRLRRAGFPVPGGFLITISAYYLFNERNHLEQKIKGLLVGASLEKPAELESLSETIRGWFERGKIPLELREEIWAAYRALGSPKVAVRSSATAEDLPEISFAGQQDTYLNVSGENRLLEAVVKCWSSLWTARAIGYRQRNGIGQAGLSLAVIVQEMVPSQVSGVVFTANPLTGRRTEMVIDATLGLGEALVSGKVEPDHYVVDMRQHRLVSKQIGAKALVMEGLAEGGTTEHREDGSQIQALADKQILELAELCGRVADLFDAPQDIEFAWAGGKLYLLQSRPVTALYPTATGVPYEPLRVMFSLGAVQGFLEPFTPLGQDALRMALTGLGAILGYKLRYQDPGLVQEAGERLWLGITSLLKNDTGRKFLSGAMSFIEPTIGLHLRAAMEEAELAPQKGMKPSTVMHVLRLVVPVASRMVLAMAFPRARRERGMQVAERSLAELKRQVAVPGIDLRTRLGERLAVWQRISVILPRYLPKYFVAPLAAGMASINLVNQLLKHFLGTTQGDLAGMKAVMVQLTRGLPFNVTTEMDLYLWETAQAIRKDPGSRRFFSEHTPETLAEAYQQAALPEAAQAAMEAFMERYGMRGVGEIDLGRPRWQEEPLQIVKMIFSYLQIEAEDKAPDTIFLQNAEESEKVIAQMEAQIRQTRGGRLKSRLFRFAASRVRNLVGLRESPKFFIVRTMGIIRSSMLESGAELSEADILQEPGDIFYLKAAELEALAGGETADWKAIVAERRRVYEREKLRRQIPVILFSDGRAFYGAPGSSVAGGSKGYSGSPVSPGVVEGTVRVILSPHETTLLPGEILVCPGTDPAWTPLFLAAGGLVMEVGGMMTHGAVVAREYGIPAVVGVADATRLLKTGQRVRLDGGSGIIELLEGDSLDQG